MGKGSIEKADPHVQKVAEKILDRTGGYYNRLEFACKLIQELLDERIKENAVKN